MGQTLSLASLDTVCHCSSGQQVFDETSRQFRTSPVDATPSVRCIVKRDVILQRTKMPHEWLDHMLCEREGAAPSSFFFTLGLHMGIRRGEYYVVTVDRGLIPLDGQNDGINDIIPEDVDSIIHLKEQSVEMKTDVEPPHATFRGIWDPNHPVMSDNGNNLGDSVCLKVDQISEEIFVPILDASQEALSYYGAILVKAEDKVAFHDEFYPVWKMDVGKNYMEGCVMSDDGDGTYLEWHTDHPHWHQPLSKDCGGFYILARCVGIGDGRPPFELKEYHVTGFRIEYGTAVYTGFGELHCDDALYGNWNVGYVHSDDYSTAFLRNKNMEKIQFRPQV